MNPVPQMSAMATNGDGIELPSGRVLEIPVVHSAALELVARLTEAADLKRKTMGKLKATAKKSAAKKAAAPEAPKPVNVTINLKYLRALRHIAAEHDIRYYLNGVYVKGDKAGKWYAATDGHRIGIFMEPWGPGQEPRDFELIVPRSVCVSAKPVKKLDGAVLKQDGAKWTLDTCNGIAQTFTAIDGKYPDWTKIVPEKTSGKPGAFNWGYLNSFDICVREALGYSFSVALWPNGCEEAAVVTCPTDRAFLGLLMPMRHNDPASQAPLPDWAAKLGQKNAERKKKEAAESEKKALDEVEAAAA